VQRTPQTNPAWRSVDHNASIRSTPQWQGDIPKAQSILTPLAYFEMFFDESIMQHIVDQSNLYAIQTNLGNPLQLDCLELAKFLGILMKMSVIALPRSRLYWSKALDITQINSVMSRDRFEMIKRSIHFNDNTQMRPPDDEHFDKLFKVRPLLDHLQQRYNGIPMNQMLCVDEQMIPFKGASSLRQYMPNKPHKYGYKVFVLCDSTGIIHDFEIYTGKIDPPANGPDLGASSNIVLKLASKIPTNQNFLLYYDNWFTSFPLVCELAKDKIYSLGTVRLNRLKNCNLLSDKELKREGRGAYDEKECVVEHTTLRVIKWLDSKCVTFLTNFESAEPITTVKRFDRAAKRKVDVTCPKVVQTYNQFMGGVDLLDSLIGLYRIRLRSKKYYHKIFFHFIDMTVVTSWLLYRRDCQDLGVPKIRQQRLLDFKLALSESLCKEGQVISRKRGRPSSSSAVEGAYQRKKKSGHNTKQIPQKSIRMDNVDHFPLYQEKRGRCRLPGCMSAPYIYCKKCEVYLCLDKNKNCFLAFHKE